MKAKKLLKLMRDGAGGSGDDTHFYVTNVSGVPLTEQIKVPHAVWNCVSAVHKMLCTADMITESYEIYIPKDFICTP